MHNIIENDVALLFKAGIKIQVDGYEIKNEEDITKAVISEDDCCMRDYVCDDNGNFIQVNFDVLRNY